ncbi:MAG: dihydroxyacetone kinase subunit DhaK [Kiloniellales bacterium]|nr:dihydroxyacetone kinase subunit DhaK [Kiloniellales bacterium]
MKKLLNDPNDAVDEMVEGIVAAHPQYLRQLDSHPRAVVRADAPVQGKVGILIGGGSGHEPTFIGYVGKGLADAVAVGNVFASPPPDPAYEASKAIDGGAGVVYLYGNYAGDVMNFDMAAEMCAMDDIAVETVLVTDDVASAPRAEREKRRGVAGDVFVFKCAGAAADLLYDQAAVVRTAHKANDACLTMGVALESCSLPQTGEPTFSLGPDEMEIGLGIHGEPGVRRGRLESADAVIDNMLDMIFAEMPLGAEDSVAVLVNGLGSTTLMEQYVAFRRVHQRLTERGTRMHSRLIGSYCTSLEMGGLSVTLLQLDDELTRLIDHPADCVMFRQA